MTILVDTDSTHDFLDTTITNKAGLPLGHTKKVRVRVANGDLIPSVEVKIQGI